MDYFSLLPGGRPFIKPGNSTGCLLVHGFSSMPEEMAWLGDHLFKEGYTVLGIRLAGHGTHPHDLSRVRWRDWLIDVEDGMAILGNTCNRVYLIGLSLGGMITLTAAAYYSPNGVIAMSTPYNTRSQPKKIITHIISWLQPMVWKGPPNENPALYERLEAEYPAYPKIPRRILFELANLQRAMQEAIPKINCPVLLIHSKNDAFVPPGHMEQIYDRLGSIDKNMVLLDEYDHAIVRDPKRDEVFKTISSFIDRHENSRGKRG